MTILNNYKKLLQTVRDKSDEERAKYTVLALPFIEAVTPSELLSTPLCNICWKRIPCEHYKLVDGKSVEREVIKSQESA